MDTARQSSFAGSIACPSCSAALITGRVSPYRVILCAACGAQFRQDGSLPAIRTSRLAVVSLALGLLSFIFLCLTGIPALIIGQIALGQIRVQRRFEVLTGKGFAVAGSLLGGLLSASVLAVPLLAVWFLSDMVPRQPVRTGGSYMINPSAVTIVPRGAAWTWYHPTDGIDPAVEEPGFHGRFAASDYDDAHWMVGREDSALVGFGYGDQVAVDIGTPEKGQRYSAYFRVRFTTTERFKRLVLVCIRDDGLIVYLNGKEVARHNVPEGEPEAYALAAARVIGPPAESALIGVPIEGPLEPGQHVLAISLHNSSTNSSDLRLGDMQLLGFRD